MFAEISLVVTITKNDFQRRYDAFSKVGVYLGTGE